MTNRWRYAILTADLLWVVAACVLAHVLRFGPSAFDGSEAKPAGFYLASVVVALSAWVVLYLNKSLDGFSRGWHFPTMASQVIVASLYLMGSLLVFGYMMKFDYSRLALVYLGLLLPAGLIVNRSIAWWLVKSWFRKGATRRVVILGSGRVAHELANKIAKHPELMIETVGFLYPSEAGAAKDSRNAKAGIAPIRTLNALELLVEKKVQELVLTEPLPPGPESEKLIANCHGAGMQVHLVPQWYELYLSKARLTEIDDVPLISMETRTLPVGALELKRGIDLIVGSCLVVAASPLMLVIALMLKLKKGKAVKKELRCGKNGDPFWMHRFNVDRWSPDLVGFEKLLAKFSLTELPQLWDVVSGAMTLVGPRPESPERVRNYSVWQQKRLTVKPGLTGLAQVCGLRELHSSEEKAHFDLQYIGQWSLFYDFSIFLQTVWTLLSRSHEGKQREVEHTSFPGGPSPTALNAGGRAC